MDIDKIIDKYQKGKLTSKIDEKHADGLWDLATEIACKHINPNTDKDIKDPTKRIGIIWGLQEDIYNACQALLNAYPPELS